MTTYSKFLSLIAGVQKTVDLSSNTLSVGALSIGGTLLSSSGATAGSTLVGDDNSYSNFTPSAATVKGALTGIDTALAGVSGSAITALTGDVTATGPGSAAATVAFVGGSAAADVNTAELAANAATAANTFGTIVKRDGSGNFTATTITAALTGHASLDLALSGGTMSGDIAMGTHKVTGLGAPTANGQALRYDQLGAATSGSTPGIATLDSGGKIPASQLTSTVMQYQGAWDASSNTPTLADGTGTNGDVYRASAAGTQDLGSGPQTWAIGDLVIYNGSIWEHSPAADGVSSVNGNTGATTVNAINQLTGDVTTSAATQSQSEAATVAKIQGTTVSGTTGTGNVMFSASPTTTGTLSAAAISASGSISGSNLSGTNTGDQTITLTGDVTGSGTGSFAATIASNAVTAAKIATSAVDGTTISGGGGSALSAIAAPVLRKTETAGEAFAANTSFAVRWGQPANSETAGRIYKADNDASSHENYNAIGIAFSAAGVSAGGSLTVVFDGEYTQGSSDSAWSSTDVGTPLMVGTSGALIPISALAGTTNEAAFVVGHIKTTTVALVGGKHLRGIA